MNSKKTWEKAKTALFRATVVISVLSMGLSAYFWGKEAAGFTGGAILCLGLGFWLTELIVAVYTKTKKANITAMALLFLGKIGWWGGLFWASSAIPKGYERPIGLGIASFLGAVLVAMIQHYGMPSISDGNSPNDS